MSQLKLNRDLGFSSKIGTILPKSGCLDTLQGMFGGRGGPGACSPRKNSKFEVFKLLEMH